MEEIDKLVNKYSEDIRSSIANIVFITMRLESENQALKSILTELEEILRTTYEFYKNKDSKYEEVLKNVMDKIQELKEKYK